MNEPFEPVGEQEEYIATIEAENARLRATCLRNMDRIETLEREREAAIQLLLTEARAHVSRGEGTDRKWVTVYFLSGLTFRNEEKAREWIEGKICHNTARIVITGTPTDVNLLRE
jgi:hypothetical protein